MQIFSGSSNPDLAKRVARIMQAQSSDRSLAQGSELLGQMEISQFDNKETRIWVSEKRIEKRVMVVQSLSTPTNEHLVEFCLICDALHRRGASEITAVIPWIGYSKQDKVFLPGEPLSAKVMAQIIQTTKIKKLVTFDLHNRAITGFFDIPVIELSAKPIFIEYFRNKIDRKVPNSGPESLPVQAGSEPGQGEGSELGMGEWVVVAPDEGAVKSSAYFARELGVPIAYMDKRRDLKTGQVEVVSMSGEVAGKSVIIVDDMIVTGSTMMEAAKYLKSKGAKRIAVAATHHLYVPGAEEAILASEIDEIVVSDSIQPTAYSQQQNSKLYAVSRKLHILSVAQMIVDECV